MIKDIWCSGNENYRYFSGWISWLELFICTIIKYCSKGIILSVYRIYKNILHFEFYYHLYTPWHLLYTCFYHLVLASIFVTCYILQIDFITWCLLNFSYPGLEKQLLVLTFDNFQIGRYITAEISDPYHSLVTVGPAYRRRQQVSPLTKHKASVTLGQGWVVPGQRPQR